MMPIEIYKFDELSPALLYEILRLRTEIFVVEQDCVYQDMDGLDAMSTHLLLRSEEGRLLSYARLIPPHEGQDYMKFGRFVTSADSRRRGLGQRILQEAIRESFRQRPNLPLKISGQLYLERFYIGQGFEPISEIYLEDGIKHRLFEYRGTRDN